MLGESAKSYIDRNDPVKRAERREKRREARRVLKEAKSAARKVIAAKEKVSEQIALQSPVAVTIGKNRDLVESGKKRSRYISAQVRDEIFLRDGFQCTFVAENGTRCGCKVGLQHDHIQPFALGGTHDVQNLRIRCAAHNRLEAERVFGRGVMERYRRRIV